MDVGIQLRGEKEEKRYNNMQGGWWCKLHVGTGWDLWREKETKKSEGTLFGFVRWFIFNHIMAW